MSEATAQKTVLAVVLVGGAVVAWSNIKSTGKASGGGGKQLVAFTILAAGLMVGASVAPQIAGPLSILILLGLLVTKVGK